MRIAYVSLHWPRSTSSGVGRKIQRQLDTWRRLGHEVQFFSHLHQPQDENSLVDGARYQYRLRSGGLGFIQTEFARIAALTELIAGVHAYRPDVIYLRWAMYVYPLQRLFKIAPTALEINTNDVEEHKLLGPVKSTYNRITRSITLGGAAGIVFPSDELSQMEVFKSFHKPAVVVSNSIDLSSIAVMPAPHNDRPHLAFIGTPGCAWHGVEKLVALAEAFPDLIIDIIGYDRINGRANPPANMRLHGYLIGEACDRVLAQADAAIGTLSMHVAGLQEASPLKVRDCVGRGIPCILPYLDTDLHDLDSDLILRIPNNAENVSAHKQEIYDFVCRIQGKRIRRQLIQDRIDSRAKEKRRLDFLKAISLRKP
jgi:hypothetical protein